MKKTFTKEYMAENCGCYGAEKTMSLFFSNGNETISISDILNSAIPLKDKYWFVFRKTGLLKEINQKIAIDLAEIVLPIYEKRYPTNTAVRECIEAAKQFIAGHISIDVLLEKRRAAYAAAAAASYAASYAAAAAAAYAAAYAASYAAADADDIKTQIENYLTDLVNNQPED